MPFDQRLRGYPPRPQIVIINPIRLFNTPWFLTRPLYPSSRVNQLPDEFFTYIVCARYTLYFVVYLTHVSELRHTYNRAKTEKNMLKKREDIERVTIALLRSRTVRFKMSSVTLNDYGNSASDRMTEEAAVEAENLHVRVVEMLQKEAQRPTRGVTEVPVVGM